MVGSGGSTNRPSGLFDIAICRVALNMAGNGLDSNSTLDKVLGYVDSPFKLFSILIMGIMAFAGYFVWQNQTFIFDAYKESKKLPSIVENRVEDVSAHLIKNTDALVVAVFKVNQMFGTRVLYKAYTKDGRDKTNDGLDVGE